MPRPPKKKPSANLHIRLPADELHAFKEAAQKSRFDFTTWVRLALRKVAGIDKR